jgi:nucleoside-diphosphate-sugar epimerase
MSLENSRILITGAGGFIGVRLAECLRKIDGVSIKAMLHRTGTVGAARLASLKGVIPVWASLENESEIAAAAEGCTHIIHCAFDGRGTREQQDRANGAGLRSLLEAARRTKLRMFVHVSTAVVHAPSEDPVRIGENSPLNGMSDYALMKIRMEDELRRSGVPFAILRPTVVWGPFSPIWTIQAMDLLRKGIRFLPDEGRGTANAIYIDNLVDAAILCLQKREAAGEAFILNDDEPETWADLYMRGYLRLESALIPSALAGGAAAGIFLRHVMSTARARWGDRKTVRVVWDMLPEYLRTSIRRSTVTLATDLDAFYRRRCRYANDKIKRVLGWRPRTNFTEAMKRTRAFLDYYFPEGSF